MARYGPGGSSGSKLRNEQRHRAIEEAEQTSPTPGVIPRETEKYGKRKLELVRSAQWVFLARTQTYATCWYAETHAGSGFIRIKETGELLVGSTLQAALLEPHFERLAFIEKEPKFLASLRAAYERHKKLISIPDQEVLFESGDSNRMGLEVIRKVAEHTGTIGLVFVDPEGLDYGYPLLEGIAKLECRKDVLMLFPYNMAIARKWQDTPDRVLAMFSPKRQSLVKEALNARQVDEQLRAENVIDVVTRAAAEDWMDLGFEHTRVTDTIRRDKARTPLYNIIYATNNSKAADIFRQIANVRTTATQLRDY